MQQMDQFARHLHVASTSGHEGNEGAGLNRKLVYRVMRDYRLLLRRDTGRPVDTRSHDGRIAVDESNRRWRSDGFEIACGNRERVRVAFALDCCEAMSWVATTRGISGDMVRDLIAAQ
jgi:putative transposase